MKDSIAGMPIWVARAIALVLFCAVWQVLSRHGWINPVFIGDPLGILEFLFKGLFVSAELLRHLLWTMMGTLISFGLGSAVGIATGLVFVACPRIDEFLKPILAGLNALPRIALAPLFLLWFGLGLSSKVALGFSLTFFIVLESTIAGAHSVNADHLTLARTLGASSAQIFRRITLPGAVPTIFAGLRLGLIYALLGVIAGEIIAAQHGLGQLLTFLAGTFQTNGVFAVLLLLALLGVSVTRVMSAIETRLLKWQ
jgi:NitT/TauT family transport system permease protein